MFPLLLVPLFTGCAKTDYYDYASEIKEDIFCTETENFTLSVSCVSREYPYIADGISCPKSNLVEISLVSDEKAAYEVYIEGEKPVGGEMTYRTYAGDYYWSASTENFFSEKIELRVVKGEESEEVIATSVKSEKTLSPREALARAVEAEKETIEAMTGKDGFEGEFYIRLLRRDTNYYYVGIIDRQGGTLSLLLDSETGEVLARRKTNA